MFLKEARGGGRKGQIIKIILASIYAIFASSRASQKNRFLRRQKLRVVDVDDRSEKLKFKQVVTFGSFSSNGA